MSGDRDSVPLDPLTRLLMRLERGVVTFCHSQVSGKGIYIMGKGYLNDRLVEMTTYGRKGYKSAATLSYLICNIKDC